jgi:uncharacterized protein (TIGR02646 family)
LKHIKKNQSPQDFLEWKNLANKDWQPTWNNFQKPEKTSVHNSLIQEQGYICCYCERRITREISHIEHLKPRNKYPNLALDYTNLIASCQGENATPPLIPVHCGHKKSEWYKESLMVSPLGSNCVDFFRYTDDGQILPTTDSDKKVAAKETIIRLALNINKLRKMREQAIEGILEIIDTLNNNEIKKLINGFEQPNINEEYEEFCSAIIYILRQYLK